MHGAAYSMAHKLANYTEPIAFDVLLNSSRNIRDSFSSRGLGNSLVKSPFGDVHQSLRFHRTAADRNGAGCVPNKPVINHSDIQTHDVPKLHAPGAGQPVHNLLIHRNANIARILAVAQKGALCSVML